MKKIFFASVLLLIVALTLNLCGCNKQPAEQTVTVKKEPVLVKIVAVEGVDEIPVDSITVKAQ